MATLSESLALSSLSNLRPSLSPYLTSPPSLSLSAYRKLTALPQFTGLRIQLPSHRSVSSFSSRNPSVLRRCARVSCEAQETALDKKEDRACIHHIEERTCKLMQEGPSIEGIMKIGGSQKL
uniref:Uncharacterized protein n=1 Tax=Quercus lobata TaxID=97700 RepID=A0A7N2KWI1_QUELO